MTQANVTHRIGDRVGQGETQRDRVDIETNEMTIVATARASRRGRDSCRLVGGRGGRRGFVFSLLGVDEHVHGERDDVIGQPGEEEQEHEHNGESHNPSPTLNQIIYSV